MNKFFDKLPFKRIAEAKIPAETIAKYPLLGKAIPYTNHIACVIVVVLLVAILSSGGSSSKSQASKSQASGSTASRFGKYPANYEIAYFSTLGYSKVPTVKDLYNNNAPFLTEFQGVPAVVTIESIDGTGSELEALLLLTIKPKEGDERKFARMEVKFQSDKMTEKSYVRYVRFANLLTGQTAEQQSYGSQMEDGEILGFFVGLMVLFWDTSKFE
jgi:hypothetical protein